MQNHILSYFLILSLFGFYSCDISDNEAVPEKSFLKIYDNNEFQASFIPIDVKQTKDEGYIILGATRLESSDFTGVYLMKVDKEGNFISEQNLSAQYVHPVYNLMEIGNNFHFVAMDAINLQAYLFTINHDGEVAEPVTIGNMYYPLYASVDLNGEKNILLQSYDHNGKSTVMADISTSGQVTRSQAFSIGAGSEVEAPIINHFTRTGKQLPFATGRTDNGLFFFNGFYNYTMSLVFTDLTDDEPLGVTQGQQQHGGLSAVAPIAGNRFAIARYNFGDNYIVPKAEMSLTAVTSSVDFEGNPFPELVADAPVIIKQITIDNEEVSLYGSHTKSGQIVLLAFSTGSGELRGSKYLGFSNPYEIAGFTTTKDKGLIVASSTDLAGRFTRICLFKLSEDELKELVN